MANCLLLYSTTDGQTCKISERVCRVLEQRGHDVSLHSIDYAPRLPLETFDAIVLGASIRYGRHRPAVHTFVDRHRDLLESKHNAFFSVSATARKAAKASVDSNPYLKRFLSRSNWRPRQLGVFAGRVDYPRYGRLERTLIRMIMWMSKGPTDPTATVEFTDWRAVDAFAERLAEAFSSSRW